MARRSDHSRDQLTTLIVDAGQALLAESGYARFSARAVAKRVGYTIGTIYNVFGSLDALLLQINAATFRLWTAQVETALATARDDRIAVLVSAYFEFAAAHRNLWTALYDHRLADGDAYPDWYVATVGALTSVMRREVQRVRPQLDSGRVAALSRSLLACVHGHCVFAMNGTFDQLEESAPRDAALARVAEAIAAAGMD